MRPRHHCPIWDDRRYPPPLATLPDIHIVHRTLCETIEFSCDPSFCLTRLAAARSGLRRAHAKDAYFAAVCRNIAKEYRNQTNTSALSRLVDELWPG